MFFKIQTNYFDDHVVKLLFHELRVQCIFCQTQNVHNII